jgi:hypothetical protein
MGVKWDTNWQLEEWMDGMVYGEDKSHHPQEWRKSEEVVGLKVVCIFGLNSFSVERWVILAEEPTFQFVGDFPGHNHRSDSNFRSCLQ